MKKINIGILGCGTIGTGVAKILIKQKKLLKKKLNLELCLKYIVDIDTKTDRGLNLTETVFTSDANKVFNDKDIHIIVETIGGTTIAKEFILKALKKGKNVVTANKALISTYGDLIFKEAEKNSVDIGFEASVGGAIPIIKTLRESLIANDIISMKGILNGTCNYILSEISEKNISFETALKNAQKKGFAEADPTLDINGDDTAHKIIILSAIAYGLNFNSENIYIEGISKITSADIKFAKEFGYTIKLLAISKKKKNEKIEIRVHPTMIKSKSLIANVKGPFNAISIEGSEAKNIFLYGYGAGMIPTASAVLSDISDIARNIISGSNRRIPPLSYQKEHLQNMKILKIDEIETNYYIRLLAEDKPNVLSKVSGILGDNDISIKSVRQEGRKKKKSVPIIIFTHRAKEKKLQKAIKEISKLKFIKTYPTIIRIEKKDQ